MIDRHRRAHAARGISLHDRVNHLGRGFRVVIRVVVHGGDAELEHLDRAEQGLHVGGTRANLPLTQGGNLEQHEQFERHVDERAAHQIAGRVKVAVDQTRHGQLAARVDDAIRSSVGHIAANGADVLAFDQQIGAGIFTIGIVERQHASIGDQGALRRRQGSVGHEVCAGRFRTARTMLRVRRTDRLSVPV